MAVQRLRSSAAGTVVPTMIANSELSSVVHTLRRQGPNTHTDLTLIVTSTRLLISMPMNPPHHHVNAPTSSPRRSTHLIITSKHPPHHHVEAPTSSSRQSTHLIITSPITSEHPPHQHIKSPTSSSRRSTHLIITLKHPPTSSSH